MLLLDSSHKHHVAAVAHFPLLQLSGVLSRQRENDLRCQVIHIINQHARTQFRQLLLLVPSLPISRCRHEYKRVTPPPAVLWSLRLLWKHHTGGHAALELLQSESLVFCPLQVIVLLINQLSFLNTSQFHLLAR